MTKDKRKTWYLLLSLITQQHYRWHDEMRISKRRRINGNSSVDTERKTFMLRKTFIFSFRGMSLLLLVHDKPISDKKHKSVLGKKPFSLIDPCPPFFKVKFSKKGGADVFLDFFHATKPLLRL
jgi:hypothetical protein